MTQTGMPLLVGALALLPWGLGIWAIVTLHGIKVRQVSLEAKIDALASRIPR
jgi:hypothetical protein